MLGRQEAHQVGHVSRVQVFQQGAEFQAVAGVGRVDDLFDERGRQDVVLVEGVVVFGDDFGDREWRFFRSRGGLPLSM
jgi:hypothetical protein